MALSPDDVERRASLLIDARRYKEAAALIAPALANQPTERLWCLMALTHVRLGNGEDALHASEQAIALSPEHEWGYRLRGYALRRLGRLADGVESVRRSTELAPHWWHAWTDLADLAGVAGYLDEARRAAERGLELAPDEEWAVRTAMFAYSRRGELELAQGMAERLLRINPDSAYALNMLGWVQSERGHQGEALPFFERALAANPTNRAFLSNVIDSLLVLERYDEAEVLAARMIELAPDMSASWCALASVQLRQRRYPEAAEATRKAIELNPEDELAHRLGAVAALRMHDDAEAMRLIRRATDLDHRASTQQFPWLVRAAIAERLGLAAEAEESLARAAELRPNTLGYHRVVAEVAARAGDCARVEAAAQAVLAQAPFSPHAQLMAGKAAVCRGDWLRAADAYASARRLDRRDCCGRAGVLLCRLNISGRDSSTDDELLQLDEFTRDCNCTLVRAIRNTTDG